MCSMVPKTIYSSERPCAIERDIIWESIADASPIDVIAESSWLSQYIISSKPTRASAAFLRKQKVLSLSNQVTDTAKVEEGMP